jgi:hypothetical protein
MSKKPEGPDVENKKDPVHLNNVIGDIKEVLNKYDNPKKVLEEYLDEIESKLDTERMLKVHEMNKEEIKSMIMEHPYFKNPNDYGIRLITIMKFLKKKGIDTSLPDIDLLIDQIITSIDGVEKLEFGKYNKKF